jgi:hypothetical protein
MPVKSDMKSTNRTQEIRVNSWPRGRTVWGRRWGDALLTHSVVGNESEVDYCSM